MQPLEKTLRNQLEKTVKSARDISEEAARSALEQLGVGEATAFTYLSEGDKELRRKLRIHGRQLGDLRDPQKETQELDRLIEEVAYEHWHRMLFARFLAENNLLMYPDPDDPVAVSLQECEDLAADEGARNGWELAAQYAARMLPQIFRIESPVFQLTLPPEHERKLEHLLEELPTEVFTASDSLGWVYQFWQAKRKEEVNASEVKIGARELPAVTQLFTEPYMVSFLLDNSLGAWWVGKVSGIRGQGAGTELKSGAIEKLQTAESEEELRNFFSLPGVSLEYLRFVKVEVASRRLLKEPEEKVEAASLFLPEEKVEVASRRLLKETDTVGYFKQDTPISNASGNLPHWRQEGVTYFVTFRLADSLPQEKLNQWLKEKEEWLSKNPEPHNIQQKEEYEQKFPQLFEKWLDAGYGSCVLELPDVYQLVEKSLKHFDGTRYYLDQYVIMPNHVHVLVTPIEKNTLSEILHSWKSYTSHEILKVEAASRRLKESATKLNWKSPTVWQKESFDHIVRNPEQMERFREYIRLNPSQKKRRDAASTSWQPAAGWFDGWPEHLKDLKTLDPCCGSGHFLVAVFLMLVPMRMELEGLSAQESIDKVLSENIHGLELDQRCVELAAFALALTAWNYPDAGGYRKLPELQIACSGLSVSVAKEEWKQLALDKHNLRIAMDWMHDLFQDAPVLGSLLNPANAEEGKLVRWEELSDTLGKAVSQEQTEEQHEVGVIAQGLSKAATLLSQKYQWVMTNVPYLARGKQSDTLKVFCEHYYPEAKNDLATVFLERCLEYCVDSGTTSIVLPQNWLFLTSYKKYREKLLKNDTWHLIARLGEGGFESSAAAGAFTILISISHGNPVEDASSLFAQIPHDVPSTMISGLDVSEPKQAHEKAEMLQTVEIKQVEQQKQLENPDSIVSLDKIQKGKLLGMFARSYAGLDNGDALQFRFLFWEMPSLFPGWIYQLNAVNMIMLFSGREHILRWENGEGNLVKCQGSRLSNINIWGKNGVYVTRMRNLPATICLGTSWDRNGAMIVPHDNSHIEAMWAFCTSDSFKTEVRKLNQKLSVAEATFENIPFDLDHWTKVAQDQYPHGLPQPYSDDPTQWIFHGHPCGSVVWDEEGKKLRIGSLRTDNTVLQVAVARLLCYQWPAEVEAASRRFNENKSVSSVQKSRDGSSTSSLELAEESWFWVEQCNELKNLVDDDGIVCIPAVRGEASADERLLNLLAKAYGSEWNSSTLSELLKNSDHAGKSLESWFRDKFFTQHSKLFQHRPFIWQIWDGLPDGFSALVNYHKLDYKLLETLIYNYLGDWINRQKLDQQKGVDGAGEKLAAAEILKKKLELILEGEAPYDIFVRWKAIEEQSIGWNPDLNDGVRMNIRPFLSVGDIRKKGAGVLRDKPNIKWEKDRGKDVVSALWFHLFNGDRINDHHLSLEEKKQACEIMKNKEGE